MNGRTIYSALLMALFAACLFLGGCVREELVEPEPQNTEEIPIVGEYVDVNLTVSVEGLYVSSATKAAGEEVPSDDPEEDTPAERKVEGIWVLQFDASTGKIVNGSPKYLAITDQDTLLDIPTAETLVDNNGDPCYVYVVANVGSDRWISSMTADFTLDDLLATTIPNPEPIFTDSDGDPLSSIPMGGRTESSVVVKTNSRIIVPVYRMFAKLMVKTGVDYDAVNSDISIAKVKAIDVGKIPNKCTVGTLYVDEATQAYPDDVDFLPWSFSFDGDIDPDTFYVVYVPENISGVSANTEVGMKSDGAPINALKITAHLDLRDNENAVIKADPQYTVYPGGNVIDNFNVRRNCVYRVTTEITPTNIVSPSANSLVAYPGELIAFYPYVRDENGHRDNSDGGEDGEKLAYYDFENHLAPGGDLEIKGLKIIWQTKDCIGDNADSNFVYFVNADLESCKIYVQTHLVGNALIAAYNNEDCTGDILWSWHIWVTKNHPDDVDNAVTYYHYKWNENGINTEEREIGHPLMDCNLGALATDNHGSNWDDYTQTFGLLYQWGRKDPFPPTKYYNASSTEFGSYNVYNKTHRMFDYDDAVANVIVYDDAHQLINMSGNTGTVYSTGYLFNTVRGDSVSDNEAGIDYSIKHPTTFISGAQFAENESNTSYSYNLVANYFNQGDWLVDGDNDLWGGDGNAGAVKSEISLPIYRIDDGDGIDATLEDNYGKYKTIFDPCPYGWRVSPGDLWLGFTDDGKNYNSHSFSSYQAGAAALRDHVNCAELTTQEVSDNMGFHMYVGQTWQDGGRTTFFPTQGSRLANGRPFYGGVCGNYHNATVDETVDVIDNAGTQRNAIRRVDIIHFHSSPAYSVDAYYYTQVQPFETQLCYFCRAVAGPIRCVRDDER